MIKASDAVLRNAARDKLKLDFAREVERQTGEQFETEYRFAADAKRRWRADIAFPAARVAVEIDGGLWIYGRHNRASGALADMEKGNAYAERGWIVFHTPWEWLEDPAAAANLMEQVVGAVINRGIERRRQ